MAKSEISTVIVSLESATLQFRIPHFNHQAMWTLCSEICVCACVCLCVMSAGSASSGEEA